MSDDDESYSDRLYDRLAAACRERDALRAENERLRAELAECRRVAVGGVGRIDQAEARLDAVTERLRADRDRLLAALKKLDSHIDFGSEFGEWEWGIEDPSGINAAFAEARRAVEQAEQQ